jgi:hypothetical protein
VHDRGSGQRPIGTRQVMVADDHLHPQRSRKRDLLDGGDRAVDGDQKSRTPFGQPPYCGSAQSVAVPRAVGQVPVHLRTELSQRAHEHRGGTDAVDVVVAMNCDQASGARAIDDQPCGIHQAGERVQLVSLVARQECARASWVAVATPHEHLRHHLAHMQLLAQTCHMLGPAVGYLETNHRRSATLRRGLDGSVVRAKSRGEPNSGAELFEGSLLAADPLEVDHRYPQ